MVKSVETEQEKWNSSTGESGLRVFSGESRAASYSFKEGGRPHPQTMACASGQGPAARRAARFPRKDFERDECSFLQAVFVRLHAASGRSGLPSWMLPERVKASFSTGLRVRG